MKKYSIRYRAKILIRTMFNAFKLRLIVWLCNDDDIEIINGCNSSLLRMEEDLDEAFKEY